MWEHSLVCPLFRRRCGQTFDPYFVFDSGSVSVDDIDYRWKSKGAGSKVVVR